MRLLTIAILTSSTSHKKETTTKNKNKKAIKTQKPKCYNLTIATLKFDKTSFVIQIKARLYLLKKMGNKTVAIHIMNEFCGIFFCLNERTPHPQLRRCEWRRLSIFFFRALQILQNLVKECKQKIIISTHRLVYLFLQHLWFIYSNLSACILLLQDFFCKNNNFSSQKMTDFM